MQTMPDTEWSLRIKNKTKHVLTCIPLYLSLNKIYTATNRYALFYRNGVGGGIKRVNESTTSSCQNLSVVTIKFHTQTITPPTTHTLGRLHTYETRRAKNAKLIMDSNATAITISTCLSKNFRHSGCISPKEERSNTTTNYYHSFNMALKSAVIQNKWTNRKEA